jgi:hypothetical protein
MQALWDDLRARRAVGAKTARMPGHYWAWMNRFDWPGRALAYDKHNAEVERKAIDKVRRERAELRERQRLELQDSQYQAAQLAEEGVAHAIALTTALARKMTRGLAESQRAVAAGAPDTFDYPKPEEIGQLAYWYRALASAMVPIYAQLYLSLQPFPLTAEQLARIAAEAPDEDQDPHHDGDLLEFRAMKALKRQGLPIPDFSRYDGNGRAGGNGEAKEG